ncbi:cation:proton antiporter [Sphingobacterium multivorum]|uniref:cation:proton antiporter n=1 Tax=Sphingobacterium multivorum TaxID=28454 RepID=UPI0035E3FD34
MHSLFPLFIAMIAIIVLIEMWATKLRVAYPILLVLAGLFISFIPTLPVVTIDPDVIFLIFLPPLLCEDSWSISFKEMKKWWRIIGSFAFLVVFFTALSVAVVANYYIPGFTLALGFLLGGIVSPPDAVSTGAIMKFVKVPKATSAILEGESLLNDASSLIIVRFALIAVGTGQFVWGQAAVSFIWMLVGGVGIGLLSGCFFIQAHKRLPTDAPSDIALTLIEPYFMYWIAEQFHSSGVLAVVAGGLLMSGQRLTFLNSTSRVRGLSVWESFVFILNGIVFFYYWIRSSGDCCGFAVQWNVAVGSHRVRSFGNGSIDPCPYYQLVCSHDCYPYFSPGCGAKIEIYQTAFSNASFVGLDRHAWCGVIGSSIIHSCRCEWCGYSAAKPDLIYHLCSDLIHALDTRAYLALLDQKD